MKRGDVYLANLNPGRGTEAGKTRPVLIVQDQALIDAAHPSTLVVPLTTLLIEGAAPLRLRISKGEKLARTSDLLIDQLRAIDNRRLIDGPLLVCSSKLMQRVDEYLQEVLGILPTDILTKPT